MRSSLRGAAALAVAVALAACGSTADRADIEAARSSADGGLSAAGATTDTSVLATGSVDAPTAEVAGTSGGGGAGGSNPGASTPEAIAEASAGIPKGDPIEIGFVRTAVSNAAAFGVDAGNTITETSVLDALVASFNERGGIGGHEIIPVYADTDTASSSWDADFAAACAQFTEDHHVVAVLGYLFTYLEAFEACLAKRGVPHLSTGFNVPDAPTVAKYPLWFPISTPLIERRSVAKIDGGLATGVLTPKSQIGVILDSCPGTQEAWEGTTEPYITSKKLQVASRFDLGCPSGQGDAGAEAGRLGSLILQFRSDGVDTVMVMATSEGPAVFLLANTAESQGWRPTYVVSSLANVAALESQMPASQARNIHGFGWLPNQDVQPSDHPPVTPSTKRCLDLLAEKDIVPTSPADWIIVLNSCEGLFAYERALVGTGGDIDGSRIAAAVEAFGDTYDSTLVLEGRTVFGRGRHDGPAFVRAFSWVDECSCHRYGDVTVPIR